MTMMKFTAVVIASVAAPVTFAFAPTTFGVQRLASLHAEIRGPSEKAKELRFGWDGTT